MKARQKHFSVRYLFIKKFATALLFSSMMLVISAQSVQTSNIIPIELSVGDKVPNINISPIVHYPSTSISINQLSGKLILIDFWGTTCSSCIMALPNLKKMEEIFKGKVEVLTVTDLESREQVDQAMNRYTTTKGLVIPTVLKNEILSKYFPHEFVSHVIWIAPDGTVCAITGTEYVTAENIQQILDKKKVNWPIKKDIGDFDYRESLLDFSSTSEVKKPSLLYYSTITGYIDGIEGAEIVFTDSINHTVVMNSFNLPLLDFAYGSTVGRAGGFIDPKELILHVKDSSKYIKPSLEFEASWQRKNTFCYSLKIPSTISEQKRKEIISEDLRRLLLNLFNITIRREKRMIPCLALVRISQNDKLIATKGGEYSVTLGTTDEVKKLTNSNIQNLLFYLNHETPGIPWVIDKTGLSENKMIDLEFKIKSFQNISDVRKILKTYGLDLIPAKTEKEIFIVTEKGWKKSGDEIAYEIKK